MKLHLACLAFACCLFFSSCSEPDLDEMALLMQNIKGRDYAENRFDVYRVRAPTHWIRKDSFPEESLTDTKKSICEFLIPSESETVRIAIHNFPSDTIDQRISPVAQVARWQRQFEFLIPSESGTIPQAFSGYSGLKFKGVGTLDNRDTMVIGWSLQLSPEHYRTLSHPNPSEANLYREMRADVTIKAVGPKELMETNEEEINRFARSFELIEEIPTRS